MTKQKYRFSTTPDTVRWQGHHAPASAGSYLYLLRPRIQHTQDSHEGLLTENGKMEKSIPTVDACYQTDRTPVLFLGSDSQEGRASFTQ